MNVIIADNQGITRAGLFYLFAEHKDAECMSVEDKAALIEQLKSCPNSVVVLDYTLFDINDASELLVFAERYVNTKWLLFSEDLSIDFVRMVLASCQRFSVVLKECALSEIRMAITAALSGQRYICQRTMEMMLVPEVKEEKVKLTQTETEILKDIALGMTTKEIADKRFSSFHTVNTHRKNIFRKLGVNNVHEATKYALRAGLVDSAEYYI